MLCLTTPACADQRGDCGTIVLPTGIGESSAADITSFNPVFAGTAYNGEASLLLFPNLLWINLYAQIDWYRSIASAVSTPDQGKTYDVTLRPWHWSDGVPVTSQDVKYYLDLANELGPEWPGYGGGGLPTIIKSFNIISATQFQVVLTHQVNPEWFIYNGLASLGPVPKHVWDKYTVDQIFQAQSSPSFYDVVDGPLKIQRLDIGLDAVFVPNPAYDGPKMHFSRLVFKFLEGDGAAVQGAESGDMDAAMVAADLISTVKNVPGVYPVILQETSFQNSILLNFKNPAVGFFNDVRVRQAMEDAIDQDTMVKLFFQGAGAPAYGPFLLQPDTFLPPAMRAGHFPVGYDPVKARALLAQAGYTPGPDGIAQKHGQRLSFVFLLSAGSGALEEMTDFIQDDFRKVGIEMKVREMDFNQIIATMQGPASGWESGALGTPVEPYPTGEADYETGAFQNFGGYSDPTMDKLINASVNEPGLQNLFNYETYASAQQPLIFFAGPNPFLIVRNRLHGMKDFVNPAGDFSPDQLYCTVQKGPNA